MRTILSQPWNWRLPLPMLRAVKWAACAWYGWRIRRTCAAITRLLDRGGRP